MYCDCYQLQTNAVELVTAGDGVMGAVAPLRSLLKRVIK